MVFLFYHRRPSFFIVYFYWSGSPQEAFFFHCLLLLERFTLEAATKTSVLKELRDVQLKRDYEDALTLLERIPKEVIEFYQTSKYTRKDHENRNESR